MRIREMKQQQKKNKKELTRWKQRGIKKWTNVLVLVEEQRSRKKRNNYN